VYTFFSFQDVSDSVIPGLEVYVFSTGKLTIKGYDGIELFKCIVKNTAENQADCSVDNILQILSECESAPGPDEQFELLCRYAEQNPNLSITIAPTENSQNSVFNSPIPILEFTAKLQNIEIRGEDFEKFIKPVELKDAQTGMATDAVITSQDTIDQFINSSQARMVAAFYIDVGSVSLLNQEGLRSLVDTGFKSFSSIFTEATSSYAHLYIRPGGDEFVIIIASPTIEFSPLTDIAEKLRLDIRNESNKLFPIQNGDISELVKVLTDMYKSDANELAKKQAIECNETILVEVILGSNFFKMLPESHQEVIKEDLGDGKEIDPSGLITIIAKSIPEIIRSAEVKALSKILTKEYFSHAKKLATERSTNYEPLLLLEVVEESEFFQSLSDREKGCIILESKNSIYTDNAIDPEKLTVLVAGREAQSKSITSDNRNCFKPYIGMACYLLGENETTMDVDKLLQFINRAEMSSTAGKSDSYPIWRNSYHSGDMQDAFEEGDMQDALKKDIELYRLLTKYTNLDNCESEENSISTKKAELKKQILTILNIDEVQLLSNLKPVQAKTSVQDFDAAVKLLRRDFGVYLDQFALTQIRESDVKAFERIQSAETKWDALQKKLVNFGELSDLEKRMLHYQFKFLEATDLHVDNLLRYGRVVHEPLEAFMIERKPTLVIEIDVCNFGAINSELGAARADQVFENVRKIADEHFPGLGLRINGGKLEIIFQDISFITQHFSYKGFFGNDFNKKVEQMENEIGTYLEKEVFSNPKVSTQAKLRSYIQTLINGDRENYIDTIGAVLTNWKFIDLSNETNVVTFEHLITKLGITK
jgi:GGDEF domain-containing protein